LIGSFGIAKTLAGGTTSDPQAFQAANDAPRSTVAVGDGEDLALAWWLQAAAATRPTVLRARILIVNPTLRSVDGRTADNCRERSFTSDLPQRPSISLQAV
jgi:hypothetical protein